MIRGVLETAGIPSILQQVGFDGAKLGLGPLPTHGGAQKVMVHAEREQGSGRCSPMQLRGPRMIPEPINAEYLEGADDRGLRSYGVVGAYARIYIVSIAAIAAIFLVWLLSRALS